MARNMLYQRALASCRSSLNPHKGPSPMTRTTIKLVTSLIAIGLGGCATSAPLAPYQVERSRESIRGAEELGAMAVPAARLHLQLAKDETETAQKMSAEGDQRS